MKKLIFALVCLLSANTALAASNPSTIPTVATIAALKIMGAAGPFTPTVYVLNYAATNDGGGGTFVWNAASTATPDNGLIFAATGVSTGRWVRQLNGIHVNVDFWGTGNADDSTALNAAFASCAATGSTVEMSAKTYHVLHALTVPPLCHVKGAGGENWSAYADGGTFLDFTGSAVVTAGISVVGTHGYNNYDGGGELSGFWVLGGNVITQGIYVSRITSEKMSDVGIALVNGPGLFWGNTLRSTISDVIVVASGSSTTCEVEIDGEKVAGVEYLGTTLSVRDLHVETAGGTNAKAGLCIDRYLNVYINGGDSESAGSNVMVGEKSSSTVGVTDLEIENFDMENPSNGGIYNIDIGQGWTGVGGLGCRNCILLNDNSNGAQVFARIAASQNFYAQSNTVYVNGGGAAIGFNFVGSGQVSPSLGTNIFFGTTYAASNGTPTPDALPNFPYQGDNEPTPFGTLPACTAAQINHPRFITDSNSTTFNAAAAGGGGNGISVGCDGTTWRVGNQ